MTAPDSIYGLLAEFASPAELLKAARAARSAGYRRIEAFSPMPVEGLAQELGSNRDPLALPALLGALVFGIGMYGMQWFSISINYPLNIGDRTPAWPAMIPPTFDMAVMGAALAIFFSTLLGSGLPRLIHPIFEDPAFRAASADRFFLCIRASDRAFETRRTRELLEQLHPLAICEVAA